MVYLFLHYLLLSIFVWNWVWIFRLGFVQCCFDGESALAGRFWGEGRRDGGCVAALVRQAAFKADLGAAVFGPA